MLCCMSVTSLFAIAPSCSPEQPKNQKQAEATWHDEGRLSGLSRRIEKLGEQSYNAKP